MNKKTASIIITLICYSQISLSSAITENFSVTVIDTRTNKRQLFRTSCLPSNHWLFMLDEAMQATQAKTQATRPQTPRPQTPRQQLVSLDNVRFTQAQTCLPSNHYFFMLNETMQATQEPTPQTPTSSKSIVHLDEINFTQPKDA